MHLHENVLKGYWNQFKGAIQSEWGALTNDDLDRIDGDATALYGVLQEKVGLSIAQARDEVDRVVDRYDDLQARGEWAQIKGKLQEIWGELTDDELERAQGRRTHLAGIIAAKYSHSRAEAWKKVDDVLAEL